MKINLKYIKQFFFIFWLTFSVSYSYTQQSDTYILLVTGNTSEGVLDDELLEKWKIASEDSENQAFLMLGNIYTPGENKFSKELLRGSKSPLLFTSGENEWAKGSSSGKQMIKNIENESQEEYLGNVYMPEAACPVPAEVVLNEHLVVILIDTYWWVHKFDRRFNKCGIESDEEVLVLIEDAIRRHYPTKHVVIAGHHSLKSYGNSDGYFSFRQNVLKAPYTFYRKTLGTRKDNHHPDFKGFRDDMLSVLKKYPDIIYASAGDANLQYFTLDKAQFVVSGSMSQTEYVHPSLPTFGSSEKGFAQLIFSDTGDCELIFTGLNGLLFQKIIYSRNFIVGLEQEDNKVQFPDSMIVKASNKYNLPESAFFWFGENYRDIWNTPVKVPVFKFGEKMNGLEIVKRGGGKQTNSLRLEDEMGRQYVLRSFEKSVEGFLPDDVENTIVVDIVQDQISASNPYSPLVVAALASLAGVYHTNPEVVYLPDDPLLGIYREEFADQLFIFEERPDNDRRDVASFGYSKDIISTPEMLKMILKDGNHYVDSDSYLRARLFDIFINDWDRHEDQWRWAGFDNESNTVYKPIPRDRDQAFFVNEGFFTWISARKWFSPRFQNFDELTENVPGLSYNARFLDREFLSGLEWEDWKQQIDSLKILISPEGIDEAVLNFPLEIRSLCADQTSKILKARIENLEIMARDLYLFLAKEISIRGSDDEDMFKIFVKNDTSIQIIGLAGEHNNKEFFSRTFYASESKRILIYSFDKNDHFEITGKTKNKIKLSIIGGKGEEELVYNSNHSPRFIKIYDNKKNEVSPSLRGRIKSSYSEQELEYNREDFLYDLVYPGFYSSYNQDDGLNIGGGPVISKYTRYHRQSYKVFANYGLTTNSMNLYFAGINTYPLKHIEWSFVSDLKSINYVNNFFGMGNETKWLVDKSEKEYYRLRMKEYNIKTDLAKYLDDNRIHKLGFGVFYKAEDVEETPDRYITDFPINGLDPEALLPHSFAGIKANYMVNTMSGQVSKSEDQFGGSTIFQTRGSLFETKIEHFIGLNVESKDFTKLSGEWISYLSFSERPRFVYAIRLGGEKLFGEYAFNEAAKLGQSDNLRGYRQTRFYGDASLYLNTELRIRSKQLNLYILSTTMGLLLFNDIGRVWLAGEDSSQWHDGYGIGLWWAPFDMALLTISYAGSNEDNLINVALKYQF